MRRYTSIRRPRSRQPCIMLPLLFFSRVDPAITVVYTGFSTGDMLFVGLIKKKQKKALVVFLFGKSGVYGIEMGWERRWTEE